MPNRLRANLPLPVEGGIGFVQQQQNRIGFVQRRQDMSRETAIGL